MVILFELHLFQYKWHYNHTQKMYIQQILTGCFIFTTLPIPLCFYTPYEMLNWTHTPKVHFWPVKRKKILLPSPAQPWLLKIKVPQTPLAPGLRPGRVGGQDACSSWRHLSPLSQMRPCWVQWGQLSYSWALPRRGCENIIPFLWVLSHARISVCDGRRPGHTPTLLGK